MKFVPSDQLKPGMRLAKPIYNKNGVMLYDRDSKLTAASINSVINFGLIGIYILEEAEPLPPLTEEDREFERFQTMAVFRLKEVLTDIRNGKNPKTLEILVTDIIKNYGKHPGKFNFMQNLRSNEDKIYKHSLNVAILSAAITGKMTMTYTEQKAVVIAALLHDIGCLDMPLSISTKSKNELTAEDTETIARYRNEGYRIIRDNCDLESDALKNITYLIRDIKEMNQETRDADKRPVDMSVEILKVAYLYDDMTAMKIGEEPDSDIAAYKFLRHPRNRMNQQAVKALTYAINIVPAGCSVQFENGDKGIVVAENADDILRPFILSFRDNQLYNLSDGKVYEVFQIRDVVKTLDNRYIMTDKYQEYLDKLGQGGMKTFEVGKR